MAVSDGNGLPIGVHVASGSPAECKLAQATIHNSVISLRNCKLIADKAYDSDPLDQEVFDAFKIDLIAPHKVNRVKPRTQDGRKLRRYKRRWKSERAFAWMHNFRRLVTRWDYKSENFTAFVHLAMAKVMIRRF